MIEDLALQYSQLPEPLLQVISYGLVIFGGIIGGLTNRSEAEIKRALYFALSGLIFFSASAVSLALNAYIVQALAGGFSWIIFGLGMFIAVVSGFFFARIAAARSRDAYGHGRMAVLGFIPFANFWLLLNPTKNEASSNRAPTIPLLSGTIGALCGFVLMVAGKGLSTYADVDGMRRIEEAAASGVFDEAILERTLATMAAEVQTPIVIDETTTLMRIEAIGPELRYVYEVAQRLDFLSADTRIGVLAQNCTYDGLTRVLKAGAIINHVYLRKNGSEIGNIQVTRQACAI